MQCLYQQTRIVGKTVVSIFFFHITSFLQGIPLKRIGRFRYVIVTRYIVQTEYLYLVSNYGCYLFQFMFIICGKNQFPFHFLFLSLIR